MVHNDSFMGKIWTRGVDLGCHMLEGFVLPPGLASLQPVLSRGVSRLSRGIGKPLIEGMN
jgi:hypothetical protein